MLMLSGRGMAERMAELTVGMCKTPKWTTELVVGNGAVDNLAVLQPMARPSKQRALKAQKFTAWGSAPGKLTTNLLSRYRRKSSEALSQGGGIGNHCRVNDLGLSW